MKKNDTFDKEMEDLGLDIVDLDEENITEKEDSTKDYEMDMDSDDMDSDEEDMEDEDYDEEEEKRARGFKLPNIHVIILSLIALLLIVSVVKLVLWNKGIKIDIDPNEDTSQFDVEVLDSIIPMEASKLEGHADDGVNTILCLGDNPFSDRGQEGSVCELMASMTGSQVYNGAFPSSLLTARFEEYNPDFTRDNYSLYYVAKAITTNDYSNLDYAVSFEEDPAYIDALESLKAVDYDNLDTIVIMYDAIDYVEGSIAENPENPYQICSYTGALRSAIEMIQETYPYVRIYVMSHYFCHAIGEDGNFQNGGTTDLGNGTLTHYLQKEIEVCMDCGVSFIDNFYGSINEDNYLEYMTDYIHLNDDGRRLIASRISRVIGLAEGVE